MPTVSLRFHACIIGEEGVATDDEGDYFDGEVEFDLVVNGTVHRGLVAKVRQTAGSTFADPLEVESPRPYAGPLHYGRYRDCVEQYAREQVMLQMILGHHPPEASVRVQNVRLPAERVCDFGLGT